MSEDGSPAGGSQQDIDEQDRPDDEGEREQLQADSELEEELGRDADARSSDGAAGDRGPDDSRGDEQDGNADGDTAEQAADGEDEQQDAAAAGAANGAAAEDRNRSRSRSRGRERQVREGFLEKRRSSSRERKADSKPRRGTREGSRERSRSRRDSRDRREKSRSRSRDRRSRRERSRSRSRGRRERSRSRDRRRREESPRDRRGPPPRGGFRDPLPGPAPIRAPPKELTMFVAGLGPSTHERDLEDMFIRYGRITEIRVNRDRFTGRCKGFGFVAMAREEEVDECIRRLDRTTLNGYRITVERAKTDLK